MVGLILDRVGVDKFDVRVLTCARDPSYHSYPGLEYGEVIFTPQFFQLPSKLSAYCFMKDNDLSAILRLDLHCFDRDKLL